jgi:hypothetical protein
MMGSTLRRSQGTAKNNDAHALRRRHRERNFLVRVAAASILCLPKSRPLPNGKNIPADVPQRERIRAYAQRKMIFTGTRAHTWKDISPRVAAKHASLVGLPRQPDAAA